MFALVVFACITTEGYVNPPSSSQAKCIFNQSDSTCQYAVGVGVIAFLACVAFLMLDVYVPFMSNAQDRKYAVMADLGFSGEWWTLLGTTAVSISGFLLLLLILFPSSLVFRPIVNPVSWSPLYGLHVGIRGSVCTFYKNDAVGSYFRSSSLGRAVSPDLKLMLHSFAPRLWIWKLTKAAVELVGFSTNWSLY